jgi:hypothetical protein
MGGSSRGIIWGRLLSGVRLEKLRKTTTDFVSLYLPNASARLHCVNRFAQVLVLL